MYCNIYYTSVIRELPNTQQIFNIILFIIIHTYYCNSFQQKTIRFSNNSVKYQGRKFSGSSLQKFVHEAKTAKRASLALVQSIVTALPARLAFHNWSVSITCGFADFLFVPSYRLAVNDRQTFYFSVSVFCCCLVWKRSQSY